MEIKPNVIIFSSENFFQKRCSVMPIRDNFIEIGEEMRTNYSIVPNMKNKNNKKENNEINHKEKIIFNQGQFCPNCKKITYFDPSEIIGLNINSVKVNFQYKCKNCEAVKNSIDIKYQLLLINKLTNKSFITKIGEFKLMSPYRLYTNLKLDLLTRKDYSLKIDNIYHENKNELLNYIYYFCRKNLTFDFLIPYKPVNSMNFELIENDLDTIISDINKQRLTVNNQINLENLLKETENEFIPINISENLTCKMFENLTPCYSTSALYGIYGEENDVNKLNSFSICKTNN